MTTNAATMMELLAGAAGTDDVTALIHRGDHRSVVQCATFADPHDRLGEEVAGVVVLHDGAEPTTAELRDDAATRLADFEVPNKVRFRPEITKGATGKLQRIGLAKSLASNRSPV